MTVNKLKRLIELQRRNEPLPKNWREEVDRLIKEKVKERKKLQYTVIHSPKRAERKKAWKELQKVDKELKEIESYLLELVGEEG